MKGVWQKAGVISFWILSPLLYFYIRLNARTRVVIKQGNKILLVKPWLGSGQWELPGGGLKFSESAIDGAVREVLEETGFEIDKKNLKYLGKERLDGLIPATVYCYATELLSEPKVKKRFIEIIDIAWVDMENVPNYPLHDLSRICLDLWKRSS